MIFQVNIVHFLVDMFSNVSMCTEDDMRRRFTRFADPECFKHNLTLVDALKAIAEKKGITPAQLSIAFVSSLGPKVVPLPGSSYVNTLLCFR